MVSVVLASVATTLRKWRTAAMGSARSYVRSVWDQTRHVAAWIPLSKVELGRDLQGPQGRAATRRHACRLGDRVEGRSRVGEARQLDRQVRARRRHLDQVRGQDARRGGAQESCRRRRRSDREVHREGLVRRQPQRRDDAAHGEHARARTAAAQAVLQALRQLGHRLADRERGAACRVGHVPDVADRAPRRSSSRPTARSLPAG